MSLLDIFRRRNTAPVARERLQVLLAHERNVIGKSDLVATLQDAAKQIANATGRTIAP